MARSGDVVGVKRWVTACNGARSPALRTPRCIILGVYKYCCVATVGFRVSVAYCVAFVGEFLAGSKKHKRHQKCPRTTRVLNVHALCMCMLFCSRCNRFVLRVACCCCMLLLLLL
ncbi:unnamed protein product [Pylaiella littoralis]